MKYWYRIFVAAFFLTFAVKSYAIDDNRNYLDGESQEKILREVRSKRGGTEGLSNSTRTYSNYDSLGNNYESIYMGWADGEWTNSERWFYEFNYLKQVIKFTKYQWRYEEWYPLFKIHYKRNADGKLIHYVDSTWTGEKFNANFEEIIEYTETGKTSLIIQKKHNNINGWVNHTREIFIYDEKDLLITDSIYQWISEEWTLYKVFHNTYEDGLRKDQVVELNISGEMVNNEKYEYFYDEDGRRVQTIFYMDYLNEWIPQESVETKYNESGSKIEDNYKKWDNDQWLDGNIQSWEYDEDGDVIRFLQKNYIGGQWYDTKESVYVYEYITVGVDEPANGLSDELLISPNPSGASFVLTFDMPSAAIADIELYSLSGQKLISFSKFLSAGPNEVNIDTACLEGFSLNAGSYYIVIRSKNLYMTGKLIVK